MFTFKYFNIQKLYGSYIYIFRGAYEWELVSLFRSYFFHGQDLITSALSEA